mmetsp:Transcript_11128/g.35477  ORF Transcript_11128/g.35477 Transcript_11128/m.35477 type:complete len:183 (+) Transcript_11128:856-1404(+)
MRDALEEGANVETIGEGGNTALHWAARDGRPECVKLLLEAKASPGTRNALGVTPLMASSANGWDDCVELLLGFGADMAAQTPKGRLARDFAADGLRQAPAEAQPRFKLVLEHLGEISTPAAAPAPATAAFGSGSSVPTFGSAVAPSGAGSFGAGAKATTPFGGGGGGSSSRPGKRRGGSDSD